MEIIVGRNGDQKTKITDPSVSRHHCKVTDNGDGTYTIENMSQSGTKVDGREIIRATVRLNSRIQLGQSFSATLVELIGVPDEASSVRTSKGVAALNTPSSEQRKEVKVFNISHLQKVWENFNQTNLDMAAKQRHVNLTRTGLGIFTMCAMATKFFFGPIGYVLTALGVLGNVYSFVGMKNAETPEERQRRQEDFEDAWVCPNPECGHSIMARNYKLLVRDLHSCPYCKCKYVEK